MYEAFYGLREKPFNLTPDPRYLYLSEKHKEAFAHLLFGIKNRSGFVMVSGEIGTGKTTICRTLLNQLDDETEVAFIFNPFLSPIELLKSINEEFGIRTRAGTVVGLLDELNQYLLQAAARGKNCVLVIDEAQNLEPSVLEQIRLLSNLETETQKLIQIILIGQPELAEHLDLPELRQLNQRITARYHLRPLDPDETLQYIAYRLRIAGGRKKVRFTRRAISAVYRQSQGTPRVINAICDRALLIGYTKETREITPRIVAQASREIRGERIRARRRLALPGPRQIWKPALAAGAAITVAAAVYYGGPYFMERAARTAPAAGVSPSAGPVEPRPTGLALAPIQAATHAPDAASPGTAAEVLRQSSALDQAIEQARESAGDLKPEASPPRSAFAARIAAVDPGPACEAASAHLLRRWNLAFLGGGPEGDSAAGLAAFIQSNGLSAEVLDVPLETITALNLPAFIRVRVDEEARWIALARMDADGAAVTFDSANPELVPMAVLAEHYAGTAVVPWRDPSPASEALRPGANGGSVRALQAQLAEARLWTGEPTGYYGRDTAAAVERLQRQAGLTADGIAGRQTRMVLSSWLAGNEAPALGPRPITLAREISRTPAADVAPADSPSPEITPAIDAEEPEPQPAPDVAPDAVESPPLDSGDTVDDTSTADSGPEPIPGPLSELVSPIPDSPDVTDPAVGSWPLVPVERDTAHVEGLR